MSGVHNSPWISNGTTSQNFLRGLAVNPLARRVVPVASFHRNLCVELTQLHCQLARQQSSAFRRAETGSATRIGALATPLSLSIDLENHHIAGCPARVLNGRSRMWLWRLEFPYPPFVRRSTIVPLGKWVKALTVGPGALCNSLHPYRTRMAMNRPRNCLARRNLRTFLCNSYTQMVRPY